MQTAALRGSDCGRRLLAPHSSPSLSRLTVEPSSLVRPGRASGPWNARVTSTVTQQQCHNRDRVLSPPCPAPAGTSQRDVVLLDTKALVDSGMSEVPHRRSCGGHTGWVRSLAVTERALARCAAPLSLGCPERLPAKARADRRVPTRVVCTRCCSCGCNFVRAWKLASEGGGAGTGTEPSFLGQVRLFTGDVLCLLSAEGAIFR